VKYWAGERFFFFFFSRMTLFQLYPYTQTLTDYIFDICFPLIETPIEAPPPEKPPKPPCVALETVLILVQP
jgi:hypothetical protein